MSKKNEAIATNEIDHVSNEIIANDEIATNDVIDTSEEFNIEEAIKEAGSKSALIRKLDREGLTRGQIAKKLNIRYQHVRNVLITPIKKEQ